MSEPVTPDLPTGHALVRMAPATLILGLPNSTRHRLEVAQARATVVFVLVPIAIGIGISERRNF